MDQQDDSGVVRVARNAGDVLENEAYVMAMASMKAQIVEQWKEAPIRDVQGQQVLLQLMKITEKFEATLGGYIQAGKLAQRRIDLDNERNENATARAARSVRRVFTR